MKKRTETLSILLGYWQKSPQDFTLELCAQRDMFVVCDLLTHLEKTQYLEELQLHEIIKLLKKLRQPKFMIDGKYKVHKICT